MHLPRTKLPQRAVLPGGQCRKLSAQLFSSSSFTFPKKDGVSFSYLFIQKSASWFIYNSLIPKADMEVRLRRFLICSIGFLAQVPMGHWQVPRLERQGGRGAEMVLLGFDR